MTLSGDLSKKNASLSAGDKEAVKSYAKETLEPGSTVISDGLYCLESLAEAGMTHTVTKRGRAPRRGVEMGQHLPCQYQGRHHRNLPAYPAPARRPLSCRLRIPLQPPFRSSEHGSGAGESRCSNRAETLCNAAHGGNIRVIKSRKGEALFGIVTDRSACLYAIPARSSLGRDDKPLARLAKFA